MKASSKQLLSKVQLQHSRPLQKALTFTFFFVIMFCFALPGFAQSIRVINIKINREHR